MSAKVKHTPLRRCVACRNGKPKGEMHRVVRYKGAFILDGSGKAEGRGAYICKDAACLKSAVKAHRLDKAFKTKVPAEIYGVLEELSVNLEV